MSQPTEGQWLEGIEHMEPERPRIDRTLLTEAPKQIVEQVAALDGSCPWNQYGQHNWLPWLRISPDGSLPSASFVTRCLACGRIEQWDT